MYNNPYNQYPYTIYNNQPNMMYQQQQPQMVQQPQPQAPKTMYHPLTFVSGIEGAKAFIVNPGQTMYLWDSENNKYLYIKSADNEGRYTMKTKIISDPEEEKKIEYLSVDTFNQFKKELEEKIKGLGVKENAE